MISNDANEGKGRAMKKSVTAILFLLCILPHTAVAFEFRFSPNPNKAHLIQWRGWTKSALAEAGKKNKPILLSLSAVWCHWCHVMDETTYSDAELIAYINKHFIPIRVDATLGSRHKKKRAPLRWRRKPKRNPRAHCKR